MKTAWLMLVWLSGSPVSAEIPREWSFLWDEGNARMGSAATDRDFLQAAQAYARLVNGGIRNGPVFHNLGTALLKARQYDQAANAFLRAERYMGSNAEIRRNLLLALARDDKEATISLPWPRYFLFWHYGLGVRARMTVAVAAFALFWLGVTARQCGARRSGNALALTALTVFALFGSSVATTLQQEASERPVEVNVEARPAGAGQPAVSAEAQR